MNNDFLSELSADFCQFSRELPLPTRYVCESARTQRPLCFSQKNEGCFLFLLSFICKIDVTDEYKMKQNVYSYNFICIFVTHACFRSSDKFESQSNVIQWLYFLRLQRIQWEPLSTNGENFPGVVGLPELLYWWLIQASLSHGQCSWFNNKKSDKTKMASMGEFLAKTTADHKSSTKGHLTLPPNSPRV